MMRLVVGRGVCLRTLHLHVLVIVHGVSPGRLVLSTNGWGREDELLRGRRRVRPVVLCLELGHTVFQVPDVVDRGLGKSVWVPPKVISETSLTCKMASLCISPVHAGIMSFRTPNSSFILDLLRRSIRLWAVFLAILRPATLVAEGCFFLDAGALPAAVLGPSTMASGCSSGCSRGFIWMILRERVGGGGRAKESLGPGFWAMDERRRILTTSLAGKAGETGEAGR
jgi:hypothetical protein